MNWIYIIGILDKILSLVIIFFTLQTYLDSVYSRRKMNASEMQENPIPCTAIGYIVVLYFIGIILKFKELLETIGINLPVTEYVLPDDRSLREILMLFAFSFPLHSSDLFVSENKFLNRRSILWNSEYFESWVDGCRETSSISILGIWDCLRAAEDGGLSIMWTTFHSE